MQNDPRIYSSNAALSGHKVIGEQASNVLKNTYMLLALALAVATGASWFAMQEGIGYISPLITIVGYFALMFATVKLRNSYWGVVSMLGVAAWLGFTTGPIINIYAQMPGGMGLVTTALGGTTAIFFIMSGIALVTKKDFSFMTHFLMVGIMVAFVAGIANLFFAIPALNLAVSAMFMLVSSLVILWETSRIVHGGETNYIMATLTLFVHLYNIFLSLLNLLSSR